MINHQYMAALKKMVLDYTSDMPVNIYLIGSHATGTARKTSDVDIAILPRGTLSDRFFFQLKDLLEESTIPYSVDIIDLSQLNEEKKNRFLKKAIIWKDYKND